LLELLLEVVEAGDVEGVCSGGFIAHAGYPSVAQLRRSGLTPHLFTFT
jgi:hypothetical protein